MSNIPSCYLTMKDFAVLESLVESDISDFAFLRLLRRKLTSATIVFEDDLDDAVAAIGRRVEFQIDGAVIDSCILSNDEGAAQSRLKLPITTMRGLALLGLCAGTSITIERADGGGERLHLSKVYRGPARRAAAHEVRTSVVALDGSTQRSRAVPIDPDDDDDPGPQAA